ncbi:uncharacterized protein AB9W97_019869 [Spinachia spinachia]
MHRGNNPRPGAGASLLGEPPTGPNASLLGEPPTGPNASLLGEPPTGPNASLLGKPPTGPNVVIALFNATNEVRYLKRQVSDLNAHIESLNGRFGRKLVSRELAHDKLVADHKIKVSNLIKENESLSLKLAETTKQLVLKSAELTVNNKTLQQNDDLEEKTFKELDYQPKSLESNVTTLLSINSSLQEELHKQRAENHQLEAEHKLLKIETEALTKTIRENEGLSQKLAETTQELSVKSAELMVNSQTWQQKFDDLQEKTFKELDYQRKSLESNVTALLSTNGSLQEALHEQRATHHQLEAEHKLLKVETETLGALRKNQEEAHQKILISKIQDFEKERTVLENICLDLKKKKRGIFGRRMQDRQTEMDKMRRKMQDKETKK